MQHLYRKVRISAALNTILFQQNLKMTISAGGGGMHLYALSDISALPFPAKRAYNRIKNKKF